MLEALARRFSCYLVSIQAAKEEDREAVAFGVFHILSNALQIVLLAVPGLIFGMLPQIILFALFFTSLKQYAGGAHASRNWTCIGGFTLLAFAVCAGGIWLQGVPWVSPVLSLVSLALVILRAPVLHPNNPKSPGKRKKLRRKAILTAAVQAVILLILGEFGPEWAASWYLCASFGGLAAAITLILPMPSPHDRKGVTR